jgi:hypothetical protein
LRKSIPMHTRNLCLSTKFIAVFAALFGCSAVDLHAQGCVAARGAGLCGIHGIHNEMGASDTDWEASIGYRWLRSDRHFSGDTEQRQRQREGSEVINNSNFIDLGITYYITPRYSASVTVPFVVHDRSSTVVVGGERQRYHTQSSGLSDVKVSGRMWVMDPTSPRDWNVLIGLGLDAPTGRKDSKDLFPVTSGGAITGAIERNVDQSIQPGDGGWGILLDLYAYYQFSEKLIGFVNGAYMITPEEDNGVPTGRNRPSERIMSIADAYVGRLGVEYTVWEKYGLTFSLANRIEGVPVYDLVGGSDWFRRPGYSISIEPGVMATVRGWKMGIYTPIAYYNNRERSVPDIQSGLNSRGEKVRGDAAFADFQVLASLAHSF